MCIDGIVPVNFIIVLLIFYVVACFCFFAVSLLVVNIQVSSTTPSELEQMITINAQAISVPPDGFETEVITIPLTVISDNIAGKFLKICCAFLKLLWFY